MSINFTPRDVRELQKLINNNVKAVCPICPECHSDKATEIVDGGFVCNNCGFFDTERAENADELINYIENKFGKFDKKMKELSKIK